MKVKRYKKAQKYLSFYRNNFGFRPPYHVLLDGTFCQAALTKQVKLTEQIPKYLGEEIKLLTTVCCITETDKLGPLLHGASVILKQFHVRKCGHEKNPISAIDCLRSLMKANVSGDEHYILATQDSHLSHKVRKYPGCPLLYMKLNAMNLEAPSEVSEQRAKADTAATFEPEDEEMASLEQLKKVELGKTDKMPKKKKKKKGPNPLSVKKKSKPATDFSSKTIETNAKKRNRKRKKLNLPNKMAKLLAQSSVNKATV